MRYGGSYGGRGERARTQKHTMDGGRRKMQIHIYCSYGSTRNQMTTPSILLQIWHPSQRFPEVSTEIEAAGMHAGWQHSKGKMLIWERGPLISGSWRCRAEWNLKRKGDFICLNDLFLFDWTSTEPKTIPKNSNESYISLQTTTNVLCVCKFQTAASWRHAKLTGLNNSQLLATFCFCLSKS